MTGKRVLITGSSTGFGRDLVPAFLERGWTVYATLRGAAERRELFREEAARHGGSLTVLSLDVADAAERAAAIAAVRAGGGLDCLINNAGFGMFGPFEELSEEQLRRQFEVNFFGAAFLLRGLLPLLRESRGRVINVSSILGLTGFPLSSAYCASKFALEGLTESLYHELAAHGVQAALVEPGGFRTRFTQNILYGEGSERPDSPYRAQMGKYHEYRKKRSAGPGVSSERVIRGIVRLAETPRMPLRYVVGTDAVALCAFQRLLPLNWGPAFLRRVYSFLLD